MLRKLKLCNICFNHQDTYFYYRIHKLPFSSPPPSLIQRRKQAFRKRPYLPFSITQPEILSHILSVFLIKTLTLAMPLGKCWQSTWQILAKQKLCEELELSQSYILGICTSAAMTAVIKDILILYNSRIPQTCSLSL